MMRKNFMLAVAISAGVSGSAHAALHERGSGLLYDDVLNVTWLQDANYAKTSGYDADGKMNWNAAKNWAADLVFHDSVRNVDYGDWRLASNRPVGLDWNMAFAPNGSTDRGANISSPRNELGFMYYVNLGLKGSFSVDGIPLTDFGVFSNGTVGGQRDIGLVTNLQNSTYWSGTEYILSPTYFAWKFGMHAGSQDIELSSYELFAWAVRDGDVAAVPEPESYAMLLAGLSLMWGIARRTNK